MLSMGKSTMSMAIFHSYVTNYQRGSCWLLTSPWQRPFDQILTDSDRRLRVVDYIPLDHTCQVSGCSSHFGVSADAYHRSKHGLSEDSGNIPKCDCWSSFSMIMMLTLIINKHHVLILTDHHFPKFDVDIETYISYVLNRHSPTITGVYHIIQAVGSQRVMEAQGFRRRKGFGSSRWKRPMLGTTNSIQQWLSGEHGGCDMLHVWYVIPTLIHW